ncbi:hypothetical protein G6F40_015950 [Rhizopus arrhizus]|nr:hypothetical protein G6F40_015950 [Rhizopus arrhizus]
MPHWSAAPRLTVPVGLKGVGKLDGAVVAGHGVLQAGTARQRTRVAIFQHIHAIPVLVPMRDVLRHVEPAGGGITRAAHRLHQIGVGVHVGDERQVPLPHALRAQPGSQENVRKHGLRQDKRA